MLTIIQLNANPNVFLYPFTSDINLTTHGSDWYWAVTGVMAAATFVFIGLSFTVPRTNRIFHHITAVSKLLCNNLLSHPSHLAGSTPYS